ncbi:MAG: hypothetical protein MI924_36835, partial [Chloroflexales bacterium]|nr:hypothetical protein [Chloroflexales bacterium]
MAAPETTEMGLIDTVGFRAVAADRTGPTGVARVDRHNTDACLGSFVGEKAPQLPKRPGVARTALRPSNRGSRADVRQILDGECLTGRACLGNQLFADAVVDILLEARLTAGILPEPPAGTAGVGLLKPLTVGAAALADALDIRPAVGRTVAVRSQVHDPHVNAQKAGWRVGYGGGLRLRDVQAEPSVTLHQLRAANRPGRVVHVAALIVAQNEASHHPARQRVQADPIHAHQPIRTRVIADAAVRFERRAGSRAVGARRANRLSRLIPGATGQLRPQAVRAAGGAGDDVVQFVFVGDALVPRDLCAGGGRRVECRRRGPNGGCGV